MLLEQLMTTFIYTFISSAEINLIL